MIRICHRPFILAAVLLVCGTAVGAEETDSVDESLRKTELKVNRSTKHLSNARLQKIALLAKNVEMTRNKYARAPALYIDKIGSDKEVDASRISYEEAQIKLAGEWGLTRQALECIKSQEKIAMKWSSDAKQNCASNDKSVGQGGPGALGSPSCATAEATDMIKASTSQPVQHPNAAQKKWQDQGLSSPHTLLPSNLEEPAPAKSLIPGKK